MGRSKADPFLGPGMLFQGRFTVDALDAVDIVSRRLGTSKSYVLDALVRSFTVDELAELIAQRRRDDADARAAWARSKR